MHLTQSLQSDTLNFLKAELQSFATLSSHPKTEGDKASLLVKNVLASIKMPDFFFSL